MHLTPEVTTQDNIRIEQYDIDHARRVFPDWDDWSRRARKWACRYVFSPTSVGRVSNVTTDGLHEYYGRVLTLETSDGNALDPPNEIAFGDDDTSFSTSDTVMNNEVGNRITITDISATGKTTNIDEYLSSNEQNGNTLSEIGVFSEDGQMYQHAALSQDYSKTSSFALTINISVTHADA